MLKTMEDMPPVRMARYERLGLFTDRERADGVYLRGKTAERLRAKLDTDRLFRSYARANREKDRAKARAAELHRKRGQILAGRERVVRDRVSAEVLSSLKRKASEARFNASFREAISADPEWLALCRADQRFRERLDGIRRRRGLLCILAGVLAVDCRDVRLAKVKAYVEKGGGL